MSSSSNASLLVADVISVVAEFLISNVFDLVRAASVSQTWRDGVVSSTGAWSTLEAGGRLYLTPLIADIFLMRLQHCPGQLLRLSCTTLHLPPCHLIAATVLGGSLRRLAADGALFESHDAVWNTMGRADRDSVFDAWTERLAPLLEEYTDLRRVRVSSLYPNFYARYVGLISRMTNVRRLDFYVDLAAIRKAAGANDSSGFDDVLGPGFDGTPLLSSSATFGPKADPLAALGALRALEVLHLNGVDSGAAAEAPGKPKASRLATVLGGLPRLRVLHVDALILLECWDALVAASPEGPFPSLEEVHADGDVGVVHLARRSRAPRALRTLKLSSDASSALTTLESHTAAAGNALACAVGLEHLAVEIRTMDAGLQWPALLPIVCANLTSLRSLKLAFVTLPSAADLKSVGQHRNLRELFLNAPVGVEELCALQTVFPSITSLLLGAQVSYRDVGSGGVQPQVWRLEKLVIFNGSSGRSTVLDDLFRWLLGTGESLRALVVLYYVPRQISGAPNLTTLRIGHVLLPLENLAAATTSCPALRELHLHLILFEGNVHSQLHFSTERLEVLSFEGGHFMLQPGGDIDNAQDAEFFVALLKKLFVRGRNLRSFSLTSVNCVTRDALLALQTLAPQLAELTLHRCAKIVEDVDFVTACVTSCHTWRQSLTSLNLGQSLSRWLPDTFWDGLRRMEGLRRLEVDDELQTEKMRRLHPGLEISSQLRHRMW